VPDGVPVGDPVPVGVTVGQPVGDPVPVGVMVGDTVGDGDCDDVGVALAVGLGTAVAVWAQSVGVAVLGYGRGDGGMVLGDVFAAALLASPADAWTASWVKATTSSVGQFTGVVAFAEGEPLAATALAVWLAVPVPPVPVPDPDAALPVSLWAFSPWVAAPPVCGEPPVSTVLLACMMACLKGWTPSETLAMTATPASTITGRSQLMAARPFGADEMRRVSVRGSLGETGSSGDRRRSRGPGSALRLVSARGQARCTWSAQWRCQDRGKCQSQCPRQVQFRARPTAPAMTLSSQG
jgi:hypothetical protein